MLLAATVILTLALLLCALLIYLTATNALLTRLLQVHGVLTALRRRNPATRVVAYLPLKLLVAAARHAGWWLELRRSVSDAALARTVTRRR